MEHFATQGLELLSVPFPFTVLNILYKHMWLQMHAFAQGSIHRLFCISKKSVMHQLHYFFSDLNRLVNKWDSL